MSKYAPALIAPLTCFLAVCDAQTPTQVPESLLACSQLQDPGERVRCYDKQIADMKAAASSSTAAPTTPASTRAAPPAPAPTSTETTAAQYPSQAAANGRSTPAAATSTSAGVASASTSEPPVVPPAPAPAGPSAPAPATAAPAAAPGSASSPAAQQPSYVARFGEDTIPQNLRPKIPPNERVLFSRITAMREVQPNVYVFWLANGQMWREEGTQRSQIIVFFRAGTDARIEKGALGSYQMSTKATGTKNWVLVTRIH